jgi:hypothetical protein
LLRAVVTFDRDIMFAPLPELTGHAWLFVLARA